MRIWLGMMAMWSGGNRKKAAMMEVVEGRQGQGGEEAIFYHGNCI